MSAAALQPQPSGGYRLKCDPALGTAKMRENNSFLLWNNIASLSSPVMIPRGIASAVLTCDVAQKMAQVLPNGHLRTINHAGHGVVIDNPRQFALRYCRSSRNSMRPNGFEITSAIPYRDQRKQGRALSLSNSKVVLIVNRLRSPASNMAP